MKLWNIINTIGIVVCVIGLVACIVALLWNCGVINF